MKESIFITGVAGFLGYHLAEYFLSRDYEVIGCDNFISGKQANIDLLKSTYPSSFLFFSQDVNLPLSQWDPRYCLRKTYKYVFHLACPASSRHYLRHPLHTLWSNSVGLNHAIQLADSTQARLIYTSSSEVYGDPLETPQRESYNGNLSTTGRASAYCESKRFGETLIATYNGVHNKKHGSVRIFNSYGPRMDINDGRVMANFFSNAIQGQRLPINGSGNQTRSFCFVSDTIAGIVRYAESQITEPLNIGNSREISILDLARAILKITQQPADHFEFLEELSYDPRRRCPETSRTATLINWKAEISLEDGLRETYHWFKEVLSRRP